MNVLTHHNDNARTGANLEETQLRVVDVSGGGFGRLFERKVDGATYAQPLYVAGGAGTRNVLYVATMRNWVYAFDADDRAASTPLWAVSLGPCVHLPDGEIGPGGYRDMEWEVGILSTPVISLERRAIYVLATTKEENQFFHRIHKLDLSTGRALASPTVVTDAGSSRRNALVGKVTLGDTSPVGPALASFGGRLYLAWKGDGNDRLNVMVSTDGGRTFRNKHTSSETSPRAPGLCAHGNALYITWKGDGNDHLNVARVETSGDGIVGIVSKVVLGDTSPESPSLASFGGNLYIAWKGDGNDHLNVMVSTDGGHTFGGKHVSPETSPQAPGLCAHEGALYITWKGDGNDNLNVAQVATSGTSVTGIVNKVVSSETSPVAAALASIDGTLYLCWRGGGNDRLNLMGSIDGGRTFGNKLVSAETSPRAPTLAAHAGSLYVGWKGDGNDDLNVARAESVNTFLSQRQTQRPGLALGGNTVYAAFASYGDRTPYNGWVFGFDADTLARRPNVFITTPTDPDGMGGIWQAGESPAIDEGGNLYFMTGNGLFRPPSDLGDSFIKLSPDLTLASWFSPFNNATLDGNDTDLGSAGVLLVPGTARLVGGGKEGKFYLLDRSDLGHFHAGSDSQIPQSFFVDQGRHIHGSPVVWTGPMGTWIYVWPEVDVLRAYAFEDGVFVRNASGQVLPASKSTTGETPGMPGGFLSISANGATAGTGIVWVNHPWAIDTNQRIGEGVLRAYDASDLTHELWNSRQDRGRDDFGNFAKFAPPTVADGRVYVGSMGGIERKVTLGDTTNSGVSVANLGDATLLLAWTGTDGRLNVRRSADGVDWPATAKTTLGETSLHTPALAAMPGLALLAWTGTDGRLNVLASTDGAAWASKVTLGETSPHGPALVCGAGKILLAWVGTDGGRSLNVIQSTDGVHWGSKIVLGESSGDGPSLAFFDDTFYLLWCGTDGNQSLNILESTDGARWGGKIVSGESSSSRPAITLEGTIPIVTWRGTDDALNQMTPRGDDLRTLTDKRTFDESSSDGPRLCTFRGDAIVGWSGTDSPSHVNVARMSLGGVSAYGRLG